MYYDVLTQILTFLTWHLNNTTGTNFLLYLDFILRRLYSVFCHLLWTYVNIVSIKERKNCLSSVSDL